MSLASSLKSFSSWFSGGRELSPGTTELAERLERLAWYEEARGRHCCAQTAWKLACEVRTGRYQDFEGGWVEPREKMRKTKEMTLG